MARFTQAFCLSLVRVWEVTSLKLASEVIFAPVSESSGIPVSSPPFLPHPPDSFPWTSPPSLF